MALPPLLIIYQRTLWATEFWFLQLPQVAGWLRQILQAEPLQHGKAGVALAVDPSPYIKYDKGNCQVLKGLPQKNFRHQKSRDGFLNE